MQLTDLIPLEQIETVLQQSLRVQRLGMQDWQRFLQRDPEAAYGIAASAWHRLVQAGCPRVDPMLMRAYFEHSDPRLAKAIEGLIGGHAGHGPNGSGRCVDGHQGGWLRDARQCVKNLTPVMSASR